MKKSLGPVHKFTKALRKRSTSDGAKALSLWKNHGLLSSEINPQVRATRETSLQTHCAASTSVQRSQQKSARRSVRRRNNDAI